MIPEKVRSAIRPTSMLLLAIWVGEFFSFGIYYFIVNQAASQPDSPASSTEQVLPMLFGVMAGVSLLAGLGLKWFVFSQRRAQSFLSQQKPQPTDASQDEMFEEQLLIQLAKQAVQPYIMSLGMINSCILFGMVLSIIQRDLGTFIPFLIGGVVGSLLSFPRLESFVEESILTRKQSFRRRMP